MRGSSTQFFHQELFRQRLRTGNSHEVLQNAPNSQQPFIDSISEKGHLETFVTARLSMAFFSYRK
jgi:hypothetical protein